MSLKPAKISPPANPNAARRRAPLPCAITLPLIGPLAPIGPIPLSP